MFYKEKVVTPSRGFNDKKEALKILLSGTTLRPWTTRSSTATDGQCLKESMCNYDTSKNTFD